MMTTDDQQPQLPADVPIPQVAQLDRDLLAPETSDRQHELLRVHRISGLLGKPPTFSGTGATKNEDFELWSRRLKAFLSTINPNYEKLMNKHKTMHSRSMPVTTPTLEA